MRRGDQEGPVSAALLVRQPHALTSYFTTTVTLRVSVVGRPFVLSTILKVALPLAAFESFIAIVFLAPAFSFRPAALPEIPGPVSVAVAPIAFGLASGRAKHGHALPGALDGVVEERRLAHSRLARDEERRAVPPDGRLDERIEGRALCPATDQHGRILIDLR